MQPVTAIVLCILVGYWLAHFVGRPQAWSEARLRCSIYASLRQYLLTLGLLALFEAPVLTAPRLYWILLAVVGIQGLIATRWLFRRLELRESLWAFLLVQGFSLAVAIAAAILVVRSRPWDVLLSWQWSQALKRKLLMGAAVYLATVFGGGYLVRYATRPLLPQQSPEEGLSVEELRNAGLYIGWLERFLVMTALLLQSPAGIGLILTGKSVARFPELKTERFAEYFLIGTFLSISIAIAGGMILVYLVYGTIPVK
jgi:hypothetical protein